MLTIAIPTFNRNDEVVETIKAVLDQFSINCQLLILDNASELSVEKSLTLQNIHLDGRERIRLIRNSVNLGAQANLLRCIELCTTEWLWILGDDDIPSDNSIEFIISEIKKYTDFTFLNYCSPFHKREKKVITSGITEFINAFEDWPQINFTSVCILNAQQLKPYLRFGYSYSYSWSCINACLIARLVEKGGLSLLSPDVILSSINNAAEDNKWSPIGPHMGKNILLELLPDNMDKKLLASKLNPKPSLEYIISFLLYSISISGNKNHHLYIYKNLVYRVYYFNSNLLFKIKIRFYLLLLYFPKISFRVINFILKKYNKELGIYANSTNRL